MPSENEPSLFLQFIGDKPKWRVIDFLLENHLRDFTKTEIAKGAKLSWASLYQHWGDIERKRIVKLTRVVGRARLYQLNEKSPLVVLLKSIEATLIRDAAEVAEEKAMMKVSVKTGRRR
ncbi:MAG: hypothetical protein NTX79_05110 [Candidatus Micrarchaeota archaeon]|nr:hypothetical protein [Candidatus Micrarchaeota archaeon]